MEERREHSRLGVSLPVECSILSSPRYFHTVSKNLSAGGMRIISYEFLSRGSLLRLNLNLIDKLLRLKAKVVWCSKDRAAERYSAGLEFMEVNNRAKDTILQFSQDFNYE